jgi:hypothetical protein
MIRLALALVIALAAGGCVYVCGENAAPIMIMTGVSASVPISALPGVP